MNALSDGHGEPGGSKRTVTTWPGLVPGSPRKAAPRLNTSGSHVTATWLSVWITSASVSQA